MNCHELEPKPSEPFLPCTHTTTKDTCHHPFEASFHGNLAAGTTPRSVQDSAVNDNSSPEGNRNSSVLSTEILVF